MVGAGEAAGGEQHDEEQCGGGKADDDGRQHQRLRHGVGERRAVDTVDQHRRCIGLDAADAEDEEIDGVRQQRQPDDDLIGARTQHQPDAGAGHDADADCKNEFHYTSSAFAASGVRTR